MCLLRPIDPPTRLPRKGYKWMDWMGDLRFRTPCKHDVLMVGEWVDARPGVIRFGAHDELDYDQKQYSAGFHCFATKKDAFAHWLASDSSRLVECEIDPNSIVAWGEDDGQVRCFVAQRIKLIGEVVEE